MSGEGDSSSASRVHFEILKEAADRFVLKLRGCLDVDSAHPLWEELKGKLHVPPGGALEIDADTLDCTDSAGLAFMYMAGKGYLSPKAQVSLKGLKPEYQRALQSYSLDDYEAAHRQRGRCEPVPQEVGNAVIAKVGNLRQKVVFIGDVVTGVGYVLTHPQWLRGKEIFGIFEKAGVNALPIVSLISFLVGMVIAFEATQPMARFGAKDLVADLVSFTMVRELGPVMTAILLAGRSGSAFAAELGTMKVNEELDALETIGLDPVRFLVVQRIIASLLLTPLLTIYAMVTGVFGGVLVMIGQGFTLQMVWSRIQSTLEIKDVAFGAYKGLVFGFIIAAVACYSGLQTKSGPAAVGASTTRSVVSGIFLIVIADSVFAVVNYFYHNS